MQCSEKHLMRLELHLQRLGARQLRHHYIVLVVKSTLGVLYPLEVHKLRGTAQDWSGASLPLG